MNSQIQAPTFKTGRVREQIEEGLEPSSVKITRSQVTANATGPKSRATIVGATEDTETGEYVLSFSVTALDKDEVVTERMAAPTDSLLKYRYVRLAMLCGESAGAEPTDLIGHSVPFKHTGVQWRPLLPTRPVKKYLRARRRQTEFYGFVGILIEACAVYLSFFSSSPITAGPSTQPLKYLLTILLIGTGLVLLAAAGVRAYRIRAELRAWFGSA